MWIIRVHEAPGGPELHSEMFESTDDRVFGRLEEIRTVHPSWGLYLELDGQRVCDGKGQGAIPRIKNKYKDLE